jgi:hypothetical protein
MSALPTTTAHVRVLQHSLQRQQLEGEVVAGSYRWTFRWSFGRDELAVQPSLGRALIEDALRRFLRRSDYQLEPGGDYAFKVRARF